MHRVSTERTRCTLYTPRQRLLLPRGTADLVSHVCSQQQPQQLAEECLQQAHACWGQSRHCCPHPRNSGVTL